MMKKCTAVLFSTLVGLVAQQAYAEDLLQVYNLARQNDPGFRAAQAEYAADQEARPQALAPLLPQLNFTASRADSDSEVKRSSNTTLVPLGQSDTTSDIYSLNLTQALYRHDRWVALRQADARVARAQAKFGNAEQDLILNVAQRYFAVLAAQDNLTFARAEREAIQQQLQQTQQRFRVGLSAITDVHEAQARADQALSQEIVAENQLAISREALHEVTGVAFSALSILDQTPLIKPDPDAIEDWVKTALQQNLSLLVSESDLNIAREEVNRQRAGHYPTLDLIAERKDSDIDGATIRETEETSLTLQLTIPIYQGGLVSSLTREAAQRHVQSKELYEQRRRITERDTRSAYLSVIANISQVTALKQTLKSSQTALEATQTGFEVGTRTMVDVLNSQRELYRAQRDYAKARYDYVVESLKLKQAAGTLSEDDLKKVNAWMK